jgi:hypothetical protein
MQTNRSSGEKQNDLHDPQDSSPHSRFLRFLLVPASLLQTRCQTVTPRLGRPISMENRVQQFKDQRDLPTARVKLKA